MGLVPWKVHSGCKGEGRPQRDGSKSKGSWRVVEGGKEANGELAALKVKLCVLQLSQFRYSPSRFNLAS